MDVKKEEVKDEEPVENDGDDADDLVRGETVFLDFIKRVNPLTLISMLLPNCITVMDRVEKN